MPSARYDFGGSSATGSSRNDHGAAIMQVNFRREGSRRDVCHLAGCEEEVMMRVLRPSSKGTRGIQHVAF